MNDGFLILFFLRFTDRSVDGFSVKTHIISVNSIDVSKNADILVLFSDRVHAPGCYYEVIIASAVGSVKPLIENSRSLPCFPFKGSQHCDTVVKWVKQSVCCVLPSSEAFHSKPFFYWEKSIQVLGCAKGNAKLPTWKLLVQTHKPPWRRNQKRVGHNQTASSSTFYHDIR